MLYLITNDLVRPKIIVQLHMNEFENILICNQYHAIKILINIFLANLKKKNIPMVLKKI